MQMTAITNCFALTALAWGLGAVLPTARADEPVAQRKSFVQKTKDFTEEDIVEFRRAYEHGTEMLRTFIKGDTPESPEETAAAVMRGRSFALRVLGETHAVNQRNVVIRNLAVYSPTARFEGGYSLTAWPAADALVQMGSRSYDAIYSRLGDPCNELDIALIVHIVLNIDGRELGVCRLKIKEREIAKDDTSPFAKNLKRVLAILEDANLPREKYSPSVIYQEGLKNPKLLQTEDDE